MHLPAGECAVERLNQSVLKGSRIRVAPVLRDKNERRTCLKEANVFISGLPDMDELDDESLGDSFAWWGRIRSSKVVFNKSGKPIHAFVQYEEPDAAKKAIATVSACGNLIWLYSNSSSGRDPTSTENISSRTYKQTED